MISDSMFGLLISIQAVVYLTLTMVLATILIEARGRGGIYWVLFAYFGSVSAVSILRVAARVPGADRAEIVHSPAFLISEIAVTASAIAILIVTIRAAGRTIDGLKEGPLE